MKIAMIILAAGFSKRMGVLKPLLPVGAESALQRTVNLGRTENIHSISVVTGNRHEEIEAALMKSRAKNIRHIYNRHFAEGMFTSVKAGIHSLPGDIDGFFLLPVDHCAVKPETMEKIIAAFILSNGQSIIYPTYNDERGHPPLIPYSFTSDIKTYDGYDGMHGYLSIYPFEEVEIDDPGIVLDMDTPYDYAALLRHLGLPTYPDEIACQRLLEKYNTPDHIVLHCRQVNALALHIADLLGKKGVAINSGLLSSACLLHDMLKLQPEHADAGSKLLLSEGYPEAAALVAAHMDLPEHYKVKPDELSLLYLADKLFRYGEIVAPQAKIKELPALFPDDPAAVENAKRRMHSAVEILDMLETQYDIHFEDLQPQGL